MSNQAPVPPAEEPTGEGGPGLPPLGPALEIEGWLARLCCAIPGVDRGFVMIDPAGSGHLEAVAWPPGLAQPQHLRQAAERAAADGRHAVFWARGEMTAPVRDNVRLVVGFPLFSGGRPVGAVAVSGSRLSTDHVKSILDLLYLGAGWVEAMGARREPAGSRTPSGIRTGLEVQQAVGEQKRLSSGLLTLANELAARFRADRVTIGLFRRGRVVMEAVSHSAAAPRNSRIREVIEEAMNEAFDQDATIVVPPAPIESRPVDVAHRDLAAQANAASVLSVVAVARGHRLGVVTLERGGAEPFDSEAIEACEAAVAAASPVLALLIDSDRWIAGRAFRLVSDGAAALFGSGRIGLKLGTLAAGTLAAWLMLATAQHRVSARAVLEGSVQRAASAPFDGYLAEAPARAGDTVRAGELLAALDSRDLTLERARWASELGKARQRYFEAVAKRDRPNVTGLVTQINQAQSQLDLADEKLARTKILAPFDGVVVSGDLSQQLGAPVERGKTLFEVAPLNTYRLIVMIDERDLRHVRPGQAGWLVLNSLPNLSVPLTLTKITPVATAEDGRTLFRAEAKLEGNDVPLRPGMEGVAKIEIGQRSLVWVWTHPVWDWVRLQIWKWVP